MAKRHHHMKDGFPHKMKHSGYYEGEESRRTQEMEDGGMIREDRNAIANMPQEVKIAFYPKNGAYMPEGLDDTIKGVDHQIDVLDDRQRDKNMMPKKV